jgi:hypothetical protein
MRSTPKTDANTSGTSTIASTFHPTGQLLNDQVGGRLAGTTPAPSFGAGSMTSASAGLAGRVNMVTSSRPRDRPLR